MGRTVKQEFEVELLPGEQCPHCGLRRPRDSREWKLGDSEQSYVPIDLVRFIFIEISHRVGNSEGARLVDTSRGNFTKILNNREKKFVERQTARSALRVLKKLREEDIVYSKKSIRRGALMRGEQPKRPTTRKDFYKDPGAVERDTELHKAARQKQKEEEDRLQQLSGY